MTGNDRPLLGCIIGCLWLLAGPGCSKQKASPVTTAATPQRPTASAAPRTTPPQTVRTTDTRAAAPPEDTRSRPLRRPSSAQQLAWKRHQSCIAEHPSCPATGKAQITTWYRDKTAALSLTYDDSMPVQYLNIYPIQKRFGFKATYFLYTRELLTKRPTHWGQSIRNWPHWRQMQADGNELGSHSVSHPYLSKVPFAQAKQELVDSCRTIKRFVPKARCETIAYPYGDSNPQIRTFGRRYYLAGRQAKRGINPPNPPDMMNIRSVIPMMSTGVPQMAGWIRRSLRRKGWTAWMFHGTKGQGWEPLTLKRYEAIFRLIKSFAPQLWVGTFGDVAKYIMERQKTQLKQHKADASGIVLSLKNQLDQRFTQPLTLRVALPTRWAKIATQQGKLRHTIDLPARGIKGCPCLQYQLVEAIPNQGKVRIYPRNVGF